MRFFPRKLFSPATADLEPQVQSSQPRDHSRNQQERVAALEADRRSITDRKSSEVEALRQQIQAVEAEADRDLEAATNSEREAARALVGELVSDAHERLCSLVTAWRAEPSRQTAVSIGAVLSELIAREAEEVPVGNRPSRILHALGFVFADALIAEREAVANVLGSDDWGARYVEAVDLIGRCLGDTPALTAAISNIESVITSIASHEQRPVIERMAERYKVRRLQDPAALESFDASESAKALELHKRNYTAPEGAIIHSQTW